MRLAKISRDRLYYSEHQTISTLRVRRSHLSKGCIHEDKLPALGRPHAAKTCFSTEASKQIIRASCNE